MSLPKWTNCPVWAHSAWTLHSFRNVNHVESVYSSVWIQGSLCWPTPVLRDFWTWPARPSDCSKSEQQQSHSQDSHSHKAQTGLAGTVNRIATRALWASHWQRKPWPSHSQLPESCPYSNLASWVYNSTLRRCYPHQSPSEGLAGAVLPAAVWLYCPCCFTESLFFLSTLYLKPLYHCSLKIWFLPCSSGILLW